MKCAKLKLHEKSKSIETTRSPTTKTRPRRYCQERMVNPDHGTDLKWADIIQFHNDLKMQPVDMNIILNSSRCEKEDAMFLSVQNIQFQGNIKQNKRMRTSFKYKAAINGKEHRMFVKETVDDHTHDQLDEDRSSQLTSYYFDDYVNYLLNNDCSRSSSGRSSMIIHKIGNTYMKNKGIQVNTTTHAGTLRKTTKFNSKSDRSVSMKSNKNEMKESIVNNDIFGDNAVNKTDNTKISFHKSGKRKSLTISRTQSPETVEVIRVDVVCNYSGSSKMSDYADSKKQIATDDIDKRMERVTLKNSYFANKYLLTNTIKSLDERVSSGAKVTLLCKTFRLSDRSRALLGNSSSTKTV